MTDIAQVAVDFPRRRCFIRGSLLGAHSFLMDLFDNHQYMLYPFPIFLLTGGDHPLYVVNPEWRVVYVRD